MKIKYSTAQILICLYVEKIHREVYDCQYCQDYTIKIKDVPLITWYNILFFLFRDFRGCLKHWKPILKKAYNQKRLSMYRQIAFWIIRKKNVERYSTSIF